MKSYSKDKSYKRSPGQIGRAILYNMRSFTFIILCLLAIHALSQNILPNSGFETPVHSLGNRWQQPTGQYEHYELSSDHAANGNYYNGICMYSSRPNEYFLVPLLERLVAGRTYHLSMNVRVWEDKCFAHHELDRLGILFDSVRHDVSIPFYAFDTPSVELELNIVDPHHWYEVSGTYIANGSERYMMIGNFFGRPEREVDPLLVDVQMGTETKKGKKNSGKKKEKELEAFRQAVNREMRAADPAMDTGAYFMLRFYFDDICLALLNENGEYSCRDSARSVPPKTGDVIVGKQINFETDRSTLLESSFLELEAWVELLQANKDLRIRIDGHTDDTGDPGHNVRLSEERANAVLNYLIDHGISADRLTFNGYGSTKPVANNRTEEGRAANRRVEFVVLAH